MYRIYIWDTSYMEEPVQEEEADSLEDAISFCESHYFHTENTGCRLIPFIRGYEYALVYELEYDEDDDFWYDIEGDPIYEFYPDGATDTPCEDAEKRCEEVSDAIQEMISESYPFESEVRYSYAPGSYETFYIIITIGGVVDPDLEYDAYNDGKCKIRFSTHDATDNYYRDNDGYIWLQDYYDLDDSSLMRDISEIIDDCINNYEIDLMACGEPHVA